MPLEVGEPEQHVLDPALLDLLEHVLPRPRIRRRPVLALDLRHDSSSSLDATESTQTSAATLGVMVERSLGRLAGARLTPAARRRRGLARAARGGRLVLAPPERPPLRRRLGGAGQPVLAGRGRAPEGLAERDPAGLHRAHHRARRPRTRDASVQRLVAAQPSVAPRRARSARGKRRVPPARATSAQSSNAIDEATQLRRALVQTTAAAQTRVIGEPAIWSNFQDVSKKQLARGEALGFPLILLILLAGFGTLVAAVAPLALGFAAVFLSGAVIYALSRSFEISIYVTNMASMIGIGVAVDYSLFIVSRFRRELHEGASTDEALAPRDDELRHRGRLQRRDRRGVARRALRDRRERAALDGGRRDRRRLHLDARIDHAAPRAARGGGHARRPAAHPAAVADDRGGERRLLERLGAPRHATPRHGPRRRRRRDARPRDPVLLDADVQPRPRRAAARARRYASRPSRRKH